AYGMVFVAYSVVQWWTGRYNYAEIARAIDQSKRRLATDPTLSVEALEVYATGVAVLEDYYVRRPLVSRCAYIFARACFGLGCAIAARWSGYRALSVVAYGVYVVTIVASEVIIGIWRSKRDQMLRVASADLTEFDRAKRDA